MDETSAASMKLRCAIIFPALHKLVADKKQDRAGAVERRINHWKDGVFPERGWREQDHAAGLVVRRFTITKHSPNINNVNNSSVASEFGSEKVVGLAG